MKKRQTSYSGRGETLARAKNKLQLLGELSVHDLRALHYLS
jgi:hypothetical protein